MDTPSQTLNINSANVKKYAGFWVRAAALMIDGIILAIFQFIIGYLVTNENQSQLISMLVYWGYGVFMIGEYQATLGKMAVGLHVERLNGEKIGFGRAALREIVGKFLSTITLLIGYLMVAFTDKKRGLHDYVADTVVVENDPAKSKTTWIVLAVIFAAALPILGILSAVGLASLGAAREKGREVLVRSIIIGTLPDAMIYYEQNNSSYLGFNPAINVDIPACSEKPIINTSPNGQQIAIFMKSCEPDAEYYCVADNATGSAYSGLTKVSATHALSGAFSCAL